MDDAWSFYRRRARLRDRQPPFVSGAEGGCQAEIGSAVAMAAGALTELRGGTPEQAVHAVGLALANSLGLVCDPVGGLVEVPCIVRNGFGRSQRSRRRIWPWPA